MSHHTTSYSHPRERTQTNMHNDVLHRINLRKQLCTSFRLEHACFKKWHMFLENPTTETTTMHCINKCHNKHECSWFAWYVHPQPFGLAILWLQIWAYISGKSLAFMLQLYILMTLSHITIVQTSSTFKWLDMHMPTYATPTFITKMLCLLLMCNWPLKWK